MSDKKQIDKLFKEQFKDFEVSPDDAVWNRIESTLHKKKRQRRIIPIWWQLGGVAAILILLLTVGNRLLSSSSENLSNKPIIVDVDNVDLHDDNSKTSKEGNTVVATESGADPEIDENQILNSGSSSVISNNEGSETNQTQNLSKSQQDIVEINSNQNKSGSGFNNSEVSKASEDKMATTVNASSNAIAKTSERATQISQKTDESKERSEADNLLNSNLQKPSSSFVNTDLGDSKEAQTFNLEDTTNTLQDDLLGNNAIEAAIAETTNEKEKEEEEEKSNRWSISPNVAPVYFNTMGKGSSIGDDFVNNTKEGDINVSYGIAGSYAINDKIKIRAGINKVELGYNTDNVLVFNNGGATAVAPDGARLRNVSFDNNYNNTSILSVQNIRLANAPEIVSSQQTSSLDQRLGFLEFPLEMEYNVLDTKFGLNLIGGFSTLLLNKNEVFSVLNGDRTLLGEATNLNSTSFSANFGVGLNYEVSKKLQLNIEPTFKYQLNTFNNTSGDFRPYFLGVYSGISFKF